MEQWGPYLYVYGIGGLVFAAGMIVAWRAGALTSKRLVGVLLLGLLGYAGLHALMQASGQPGPMPETGKIRGTEGFIGTWVDAAVVIGYFVVVIGVGSYFARFTRSSSDFFFGGRRFKGWLVALSCVATTIGSYSFLKYASVGFRFGLSSTMTYLNDWFWMPLWMLVWLPIIYYGRMRSIPEYFDRRFGRSSRMIATIILLVLLLGYISINFFTLGKAIHTLTGWPVLGSACGVACATAVYVAFGGQTSVIMTDLAQAVLLLVVGIGLFVVGVMHLGGFEPFWGALPDAHKMGLAPLKTPASFNTMGVFWQDAMAGGVAFYFINQGVMMRFMSARSVKEGRKAVALVVLVVMPLAALAVSGVGWVARGMIGTGELPAMTEPDNVFIIVSAILAKPGVFGLIMAALVAALMSTVDTLVTATSAVVVNDIWKPYFGQDAGDKQVLRVARITTVASSATALALVPIFMNFDSIYVAHAAFVAAVVPPMAVTLLLGITWPRFGSKAAVLTLVGGSALVGLSLVFPEIIEPFAQGSEAHKYMRAFFGLATSSVLAIVGTLVFRQPPVTSGPKALLVAGPEDAVKEAFKGGTPKPAGATIELRLNIVDEAPQTLPGRDENAFRLHPDDQARLGASPGDLLIIAAPGEWHGGLKSVHGMVSQTPGEVAGRLDFPQELEAYAGLRGKEHAVVTLEG